MCLLCDKENLPVEAHFNNPICENCLSGFNKSVESHAEKELDIIVDLLLEDDVNDYGNHLVSAIILEFHKYIDQGFFPMGAEVHSKHMEALERADAFDYIDNESFGLFTLIGLITIKFVDDLEDDFCITE